MEKYTARNIKVFTELEALIEKLGYGSMDYSLDIHNKRISRLILYGKKRLVYKKADQDKAYMDIVARIKQAADTGDDIKLTFSVDISKGVVKETLWMSKFSRNYEELDK